MWENGIEKHMSAERQVIPFNFSLNHQNYSRYLTYQHCFLSNLKYKNHGACKDLVQRGFGASYSGSSLSSVHGDLVTEYMNREVKSGQGPLKSGFSSKKEHRQK